MTKSGALLALPQDFVILTVKTLLKSRLKKRMDNLIFDPNYV